MDSLRSFARLPWQRRRLSALVLSAAGALSLATLAWASDPPKAKQNWVIGSMIWNTSVPFYANFIKGQNDAAARYKVVLKMANGKGDLATEVAAIRQMIADHVDAILVTASDAQGIVPAIKLANAAGIPVFAVNNRVGEGAKIVTFIGADDVEFGRQQAHLLLKTAGPNVRIAYLMGAIGTSAQRLRQQGFDAVLKDHPALHIVASQTSNWDSAQALRVVQDWLNKFPKGTLDVIVAQGPEGANAARYAASHGRTEIQFIVGDYPADVRHAIQAGQVVGTVDQDPRPQGDRSVTAAVQWLNGDRASVHQPQEYLPLPIVTRANVEATPAAWGQ